MQKLVCETAQPVCLSPTREAEVSNETKTDEHEKFACVSALFWISDINEMSHNMQGTLALRV